MLISFYHIPGVAEQADPRKKENEAQDPIDRQLPPVAAAPHKGDRCHHQAGNTQNSQHDTKDPFFHSIGDCTIPAINNVPLPSPGR